jgi:hypothetical protein
MVVHAMEFYFGNFFAEIPNNDYIEYFAPDYTLKVPNLNMVKKLQPICLNLSYTWFFFLSNK